MAVTASQCSQAGTARKAGLQAGGFQMGQEAANHPIREGGQAGGGQKQQGIATKPLTFAFPWPVT
jgi:hypothetical protein